MATKHESLRLYILKHCHQRKPDRATFNPFHDAMKHGLPGDEGWDVIIEMHRSGLIDAARWDGTRERSYQDWASDADFRDSTKSEDRQYVRVKILLPGIELFESMPKGKLGF